jgi:AcrR family transcriptional regulator
MAGGKRGRRRWREDQWPTIRAKIAQLQTLALLSGTGWCLKESANAGDNGGYPSLVEPMTGDELFRTTLPPGRHKLPRDFVEQHQRARLFAAMIELVDEQGYPATSLTQIVKKAGVARHTFYEHFKDKEELFLALFDEGTEWGIGAAQKAAEAEKGPWEAQIRAAIAALLVEIVKNPALARVVLIESQSAGLAVLARYEDAMHRWAAMLRGGRAGAPGGADLPQSLEDIAVGGVVWMLNRRLAEDPEDVESLLPGILEFLFTPYLGESAAREAAWDDPPRHSRG